MLFRAEITEETIESEDKLCEQLYIFLEDFVPKRLKYEISTEREDCVQETILYLLERFRKLEKGSIRGEDIEKFFYNRANSFISGYIRKLKVQRVAEGKYIYNDIQEKSMPKEMPEDVDYDILENIIKQYNLTEDNSAILLNVVEQRLLDLGYEVNANREKLKIREESLKAFEDISYSVVDEYLVKSLS